MPIHMFIIHHGLHGESAQGGHKVINRQFLSVKEANVRLATTSPTFLSCHLAGQAFISN